MNLPLTLSGIASEGGAQVLLVINVAELLLGAPSSLRVLQVRRAAARSHQKCTLTPSSV